MQQQHGVTNWGVYPNAAAARSWPKGVYPPVALQQRGKRDCMFGIFFNLRELARDIGDDSKHERMCKIEAATERRRSASDLTAESRDSSRSFHRATVARHIGRPIERNAPT